MDKPVRIDLANNLVGAAMRWLAAKLEYEQATRDLEKAVRKAKYEDEA